MARPTIVVPYVVALIAVIVTVDVVFFRNHFWERLMVNIGIVLVFGAFYLRFLKHRIEDNIPKRLFRISSVRFDKKLTIRPVGWNDAVAVTMFL